MLANQPKRQCFSVESLAVSSRTDHEDTSRDTASPYVHYVATKVEPEVNNNISSVMQYVYSSYPYYNLNTMRQFEAGMDLSQSAAFPGITTSTPIATSVKRRRICSSSSTSPNSSEDERLVTDMSVTSESVDDEKRSISSCTSPSVTSDPDLDSCQDDSMSKRKKARTAFTSDQLQELEKRYTGQKYLSASDRTQLARALKLKDQQVKTWFQNRRMKEKRQQKEDEQSHGFSFPTGGVDIAHLAALGFCPPPYGPVLGSNVPYNNQAVRGRSDSSSPSHKQSESPSPVYKVDPVKPAIPIHSDRLGSVPHPSFIASPFALSSTSPQHPLLHYGYHSQFSPSLQLGKRS